MVGGQAHAQRRRDHRLQIARRGRHAPRLPTPPHIDHGPHGAAPGAQDGLRELLVEAAAHLLVAIQRRHVGEGEIKEQAMDHGGRIGHDRGVALLHDGDPMAREEPQPQRPRTRTALRHGGDIEIGAIGEIKRHGWGSSRARGMAQARRVVKAAAARINV